MTLNPLTPQEQSIILYKATEPPFTGEYTNNKNTGTYLCKQCDAPLYKSDDKFESSCGWASFDDEVAGAVLHIADSDGIRTEIVCARCGAHLGHIFINEGFTPKNTRHCVNSISLKFIPGKDNALETAYFASGCFWGTEYHFMKADGVIKTAVGFMGGHTISPSYRDVCTGTTGHIETTQVVFDTHKTNYEALIKLFFETHNFTQLDGQGPDIGEQYHSVIFYANESQKEIAKKYIEILINKHYHVATELRSASVFWKAEDYHQQYYEKKDGIPYCHVYRRIF